MNNLVMINDIAKKFPNIIQPNVRAAKSEANLKVKAK